MRKHEAAGLHESRDHSHEKRQFRKALDLWEEKVDQESQLQHEKSGKPQDIKKWRGFLHAVAGLAMSAYCAGIDGRARPGAIAELENMSELTDDVSIELRDALITFISNAYEDGKKARG